MRNRLLLAALALAAALAWLALASRPSAPRAAPAPGAAPAAATADELRPARPLDDAQRIPTHHVLPGATRGFDPAPSAPEEERESATPARHFHGVVHDARTGLPIAGARATLSGADPRIVLGPLASEGEAISDAAGRFQIPLTGTGLGSARLAAEGCGPLWFVYDAFHDAPERALRLELLAAAELEVRVLDPEGRPRAGAVVELSELHEPVWRAGGVLIPSGEPEWSARTDAAGLARFEGLCAEWPLSWSLRDARGSLRREGRLALAPGERRRVELVLGNAAGLRGRVRDEHGAPVAELALRLVPELGGLRRGERPRVLEGTSDATGAFEFRDVPYGSYRLGFEAAGRDLVAREEPLSIERDWSEHDLVLTRGLWISGRLVGAGDGLGELGTVSVRALDGSPLLEDRPSGSSFRVGPLAPGEYLVAAGDGERASEGVRARAGEIELELVLHEPTEVSFRIQGSPGPYEVQYFSHGSWFRTWSEPRASFRMHLAPGLHAVLVTTAEGQVAFLPRLEIGARAPPRDEVVLDLRPGAQVTLVHRATEGVRSLRLALDGASVPIVRALFQGDRLVPGASTSALVPAGSLTAELLEDGRVVASESLELAPGERRRIELEPR